LQVLRAAYWCCVLVLVLVLVLRAGAEVHIRLPVCPSARLPDCR